MQVSAQDAEEEDDEDENEQSDVGQNNKTLTTAPPRNATNDRVLAQVNNIVSNVNQLNVTGRVAAPKVGCFLTFLFHFLRNCLPSTWNSE